MRSRFCGEIKDGQVKMEDSVWTWRHKNECPEKESQETRPCFMGTCLPQSNDFWKTGNKPFRIQGMWAVAPKVFENKKKKWGQDWKGGCTDWSSAYKKVNLDSMTKFGKHNEVTGFAECMRICQEDEKDKCLSVTFFPSLKNGIKQGPFQKKFYGFDDNGKELFNCYLYDRRCHEGEGLTQKYYYFLLSFSNFLKV